MKTIKNESDKPAKINQTAEQYQSKSYAWVWQGSNTAKMIMKVFFITAGAAAATSAALSLAYIIALGNNSFDTSALTTSIFAVMILTLITLVAAIKLDMKYNKVRAV